MLNFKKSFLKKNIFKNSLKLHKNLFFGVPSLNLKMFIQINTVSKKIFSDTPLCFFKSFLKKTYKKLNTSALQKFFLEQVHYSFIIKFNIKQYYVRPKNKFSFFSLNFNLKKHFYIKRFIPNLKKIFFIFLFINIFSFKNIYQKRKINNIVDFFFILKVIDENLVFLSFFISLWKKFVLFTCLGFKIYNFRKYKNFSKPYLTLNSLLINRYHIFQIVKAKKKKKFRFNFFFVLFR